MYNLSELTQKILTSHIDPKTRSPEIMLLGYQDDSVMREHLSRYIFSTKYAHGIVLDCAAGSCYGSSILKRSKAVNWVISVDMDKDLLKYGQIVFDASCVCAVASNLPFKAQCFDSVISLETLEHLRIPSAFMKNIVSCLKQNGVMLLTTPNKFYSSPFLQKPLNPYHINEYYLSELINFLESFPFKIKQVYGGKRTPKLPLMRRIFGSFIKFLLCKLSLNSYLIDTFYLSISKKSKDNTLTECETVKCEHTNLKKLSNLITYQYFVVIACKVSD